MRALPILVKFHDSHSVTFVPVDHVNGGLIQLNGICGPLELKNDFVSQTNVQKIIVMNLEPEQIVMLKKLADFC